MTDSRQPYRRNELPRYTSRRAFLTTSTSAGLLGLFIGYALVVRPMIASPVNAPPGLPDHSDTHRPGSNDYSTLAATHLSRHPWAADAAYKMGIGNSIVYFQDWQRADSDRTIRFRPFAMIYMPKGYKPGDTPITIYSDSAYVEFANRFDFQNAQPGRVVGGALEGAVRITGADNLTLNGRNFHFSEDAMSIWCDTDVAFTYQKHAGNALGMQLELIPDVEARKKERFSASGVRKITLLQNVAMNLVSESDPNKPGAKGPVPLPGRPNKTREPQYVRVRSAGSFVFVLESNVATFEENVKIHSFRPSKPDDIDELRCDLLTMVFTRKGSDPKSPGAKPVKPKPVVAGPAGGPQGLGGDFEFQRLSADGRRVVLMSHANKLTAVMTRLIYDGDAKVAELTAPNGVRVLQDTSEMQSPLVEIVHNEKGDVTHVSCRGAGSLKSVDPRSQQVRLTAQWEKELRKFPDPESNLDIIELEKEAFVRQPIEQMGLGAEFIRLWIDRTTGKKKPAPPVAGAPKRPGPGGISSSATRPRRMLAETNVKIVGPQMNGKGNRLEAWFDDRPQTTPSDPQTPGVKHAAGEGEPDAVAGASTSSPFDAPGGNKSSQKKNGPKDGRPGDGPMEVSADLFRILVLQGPGDEPAQVAEVWTKGNIDITQVREGSPQPLKMTGDVMRLVNQSDTQQTVHVQGGPAHIRTAEMHIEGNHVKLDRGQNLAWVEGTGLLEMPVSQDMEGHPLAKPELLTIWWNEKMTFDGKRAEFLGNVRTLMEDSKMHCAKMVATMSREYSFTKPPPAGEQKIEIEGIACTGGVDFKSQRYEGSKLSELRQGEFFEFALNRQTGETTALGPGHILSWQRGHGRRASFVPQSKASSNAVSRPNDSEWEFSRIKFSGTMQGNMNERTTTFHDRVQIVYAPVDRPEDIVDPDKGLTEQAGWMRCDALTVTQVKDPKTKDGHVELLGAGNTELEGRDFHARADQVTYDESKGLYTLRSEGNRKATVWQQKAIGGNSSASEGQSIEFVPAKKLIKIDRSTGGGGSF